MLYCGIRPAEVQRLGADDVCWEDGVVIIRPQVSKTGGGRVVPLRGVGRLRHEECTVPRNWGRRWQELRRAAGFSRWVPDVCRLAYTLSKAARGKLRTAGFAAGDGAPGLFVVAQSLCGAGAAA